MATGAGVCLLTAVTTSSSTIYHSGAVDTAGGAITAQSNFIATCWNPATGTTVSATSPAVILACHVFINFFVVVFIYLLILKNVSKNNILKTSRSGVGSVVSVTVGATTTATTSVPSLTTAGSYCFSTNCNHGLYVSSGLPLKNNVFVLLLAAITSILLF